MCFRTAIRTQVILLVTTLLDPRQATKEDLAALRRARWHNELEMRTIKSTMQMRERRGSEVLRK